MTNAKFVISLDFELFWGVSDTQTIASYGRNVLGEWEAIPRMLKLFHEHRVRVTWATVGMIMCRDHAQWQEVRPSKPPGYMSRGLCPYSQTELAKHYPMLFFARPLVHRILETEGQELASHTYSHFYCGERGVTPDQFAADLRCARTMAAEMGADFQSVVLPRNQIVPEFLAVLPEAGVRVYRGNRQHWLYRNGDAVVGGIGGRAARFADACLPLSGPGDLREQHEDGLLNVPASMFLYPWSNLGGLARMMRLHRLKQGMTAAAKAGTVFHLWWHPHNFGIHLEQNVAMLEEILRHYHDLADQYGMQSHSMGDFAQNDERYASVPAAHRVAPQLVAARTRAQGSQR